MSVRKLSFTLSAGGISPQTVQPGGVQFEHNATEAIFIIPGNLFELIKGIGDNKTVLYRVDAIDGEGGYHPSAPIEPILTAEGATDYQLTYPVLYGVSSIGGTCQLTVVATRMDENSTEEMIYCSETARIEFSHVSRSNKQHDDFKGELGGILNEAKGYMIEAAEVDDSGKLYVRYVNGKTVYVGVSNLLSADTIEAAIHATDNANVAAENAMAATDKANTAADDAAAVRREVEEGGFVESLKEMHTGSKFSFWVGTKAEYEAIPKEEIVENCFYMITDDSTTKDLKKYGKVLWNNSVTNDYSLFTDVLCDVTKYSIVKSKITYGLLTKNLINILFSLDEIKENDDTGNKTYLYSGNTTYYGLVGAVGDIPKMISYGITLTIEVKTDGTTTGTVKVYSVYFQGDSATHAEITEDITAGSDVVFEQIIGVC